MHPHICRIALALAVGASLVAATMPAAHAEAIALPLSGLGNGPGTVIDGAASGDLFGGSVSAAGDINGDGLDDLIVGAKEADLNGSNSGGAFVFFGRTGSFPLSIALSALDGSNGFAIHGERASDFAGRSVSAAGDVNGDGIDDLLIGADFANRNGTGSGRSYVVFGRSTGFGAVLQLSSLDGSTGFAMDGQSGLERSGTSVSSAGDINADGIDDLIIGAPQSDANANDSGRAYVVFGRSTFPAVLQLSALNGTDGFIVEGESAGSLLGTSVSAAGDLDGDGRDDLVVGAPGIFSQRGGAFVLFGRSTTFPRLIRPALLGSAGIMSITFGGNDTSPAGLGRSFSATGDINDDGKADLVIGAPTFSGGGRAFIIFGGQSSILANTLFRLSALNGSNGFAIAGEVEFDGFSVSLGSAGDVDADGIDDLVIGASGADPNGNFSGRSYVVFGRSGGFPALLRAAELDGGTGYAADGEIAGDELGASVSNAADLNNDGRADVVFGAPSADFNGTSSGRSYVMFGFAAGQPPAAPLIGATTAGDTQASISFTPSDDGGSPITGFTATSTPDGLLSVGCVASPCTVAGLSNGTSYTFTVTATSANGTSLPSQPSNPVVPRGSQSVAFGANPGPLVFAGVSGEVSATASSGLAVRFSSASPAICTVDAGTGDIAMLAAGTCTINADQDGNAAFAAAPQVSQQVLINPARQTITIAATSPLGIGEIRTLSVSGGASGNPITLSALTPSTCSVGGLTVTGLASGICTVVANQQGNDNFLAADPVESSLAVADLSMVFKDGFEATP